MDGRQCMTTTSHTKPTWPWWGNALEIIPGLEQHFIEDFWAVAGPSLCFLLFLTCSSCFSAHAWSAEKHFIDIVNEVDHHIDHHIDIVGTGHLKEGYREGFQVASGCQLTEDVFLWTLFSMTCHYCSHLSAQPKGMGFSIMFSCLVVKLWNLYQGALPPPFRWVQGGSSSKKKTCEAFQFGIPSEGRFIWGCTAAGATKSGGLCEELDSVALFSRNICRNL